MTLRCLGRDLSVGVATDERALEPSALAFTISTGRGTKEWVFPMSRIHRMHFVALGVTDIGILTVTLLPSAL